MQVNSLSPTFCGLKASINAQRNISNVKSMISGSFYTEGKRIGKDGSFVVKGYKPTVPSKELGPTSLSGFYSPHHEITPSYVAAYSPEEGLKTKIASVACPDVSYVVSQKDDEKAPVIDTFYKGTKVNEAGLIEDSNGQETFSPLMNILNKIDEEKGEVAKAIGRFIPTLNDLKL